MRAPDPLHRLPLERREENPAPKEDGRSKYIRTPISKPGPLSFVPRRFARYGMSEEEFVARVKGAKDTDAVLVTSMMTYWYPGVRSAIMLVEGGPRRARAGNPRRDLREALQGARGPDLGRRRRLHGRPVTRPLQDDRGGRGKAAPLGPAPRDERHLRFPRPPGPDARAFVAKQVFALLHPEGMPLRVQAPALPPSSTALSRGGRSRRSSTKSNDTRSSSGRGNLAVYDDAFLYQRSGTRSRSSRRSPPGCPAFRSVSRTASTRGS